MVNHREEDLWSQGVKDGIRKCMVLAGMEEYRAFTGRVDQRVLEAFTNPLRPHDEDSTD